MTNKYLSAERRPSIMQSLLLVLFLPTLHLTDANTVVNASDGSCRLYDYISGFSVTKVNNTGYKLDAVSCQGLPQPHAGQPTQCVSVTTTVDSDRENWNQCDPGFYLQGNDQMNMICCKPSSHPYTWYDCSDVPVEDNSYEVQCPAGFIVTKTRDRQCGSSVCTSAINCCAISDEPGLVKTLDDVKARVMDDTQVPLSLLAHFLGFGWCGGYDGRYVGENMEKSGDEWISSTNCTKNNQRLKITYSDFKLIISEIALSDVTQSVLKPYLLTSGALENDDTSPKTVTVGQEIHRQYTRSHTKQTSFTVSETNEIEVSSSVSIFGNLGISSGFGASSTQSFGYETTEEAEKRAEISESSSVSYASEITLEPCTALKYEIHLVSGKATQYYNATIDVSYSATLQGVIRDTNFHEEYRGSSKEPCFTYKFGSSQKSLYDDLEEQNRNDKEPWEWKSMEDRYRSARRLLDILTDPSRHKFNLEGRFDEIIGQTAYISFHKATPPAGCTVPGVKKRSVSNNASTWPVIDFSEKFIRYIDLETGSYSDRYVEGVSAAGPVALTKVASAGNYQEGKDEEKILYYLPIGNRNPKFDFSKFFVELKDDNLIQPARDSNKRCASSAAECHRCLIVVCIVGIVLGKWFYAT